MLRPHEMSSVVITGPKSVQEPIIRELHDMKILHIVEHSKNELADIGIPLESAGRLSETLVKARALISALGIKKEGAFELKKELLDVESNVNKLNGELNSILEELKRIDAQLAKNDSIRQELELLKGININLDNFTSCKSLASFTGYISSDVLRLKDEISKITKSFMLLESKAKKRNFIALFADRKSEENISDILKKRNFAQVNLANVQGMKGAASQNLARINDESLKLQKLRNDIMRKIEKLGTNNKGFLIASEIFLREQLEKAEAPLKFASTTNAFLAKGWIPSEDLKNSIERLNKAGRNKIYIQFEPAKSSQKAPVKQKNPNPIKPFQFFMDLYSIPTYREIDPTFFVFLTFPIFFGIMLGDIGYGIVSLGLFWFLKIKMPKAKNFFNVLILASLVSIIFGFLYGEFFGLEEIGNYHLWHALSRAKDMFTLMYISLAIGAVHVNIGLIIGFINVYGDHGLMAAIYEKAGWIVLELGVAMLALSHFKIIVISPWIGAVFLAAAVMMLFKGEGVKGIMELPSIFTNILSYARLMAIGLSSVILAVIVNDSAGQFFHKGGFFILIGILILVIGHLINIMLGLLGSFLHSLRLHYVEFFSKFFTGGAKKYAPFGLKDE
ncbi:V-type ATP synthase subunit I [Candidatus Woesearchaeota archaeon]|nr:V-type ATP synthase subunit I [Candidatus Woesearchaeota archaeon]